MRTLSLLALICVLQLLLIAPGKTRAALSQPSPSPTPPQRTQQPDTAGDDDVVRITTKLVQVDAVVTDKDGKFVTDLRPDEIRIMEDGRPQKITHFSLIKLGSVPGAPRLVSPVKTTKAIDKNALLIPPVPLRPEQVHRTMAMVVDDLGLSAESVYLVRGALRKFVDEQMEPGDLVAIIRTSGGIGALQQFTSDKRILYAAIERIRWYQMGRGGMSAIDPIKTNPMTGVVSAADLAMIEEADSVVRKLEAFRENYFEVGTMGAVHYVVAGLKEMPGRKSLLLIADGIKIGAEEDRAGSSNRVQDALMGLTEQANRASVVINTMDARGLQTLSLSASDSVRPTSAITRNPREVSQLLSIRHADFTASQDGLRSIAEQTGGLAIQNNNDLSAGLRTVLDDQQAYYLVGYRPDESTFDAKTGARKYHSLTLKVTRPGRFTVRMRKGFFGITDAEAKPEVHTPQQQVAHALTSPFGATGVHVRLTSAFSNDAERGSLLSSMLHVSGSDLTFTDEPDGWHKADFDVVAITYGDNGRIVDQVGQTHTIRVRGDSYQNVLKEGFVYIVEVPVKKPGAYQLRVALRDHSSEQIGSASQFVQVPDLTNDQLTLSSVLVNGIDPATLHKPAAGAAVNNQNQSGTEEVSDPRNAAAVRQFHGGTILQYGFAMYNARLDKVTGRPQLKIRLRILRDGTPVFTGQDEAFELGSQSDLKRLTASGGIQLGSQMTPGEYVFQVIVTDLLAEPKRRVATQWIDFEIIK